jgi:tRNA-uridine 2-sulfurtransferase
MALELGAEKMATGHYIRLEHTPDGPILSRARDADRDQSYFLFATTRAQLAFLRFPLGSLDKQLTRAIARRLGLPVAEKKDSQDICFVPDRDYGAMLARLRPEAERPGEIVDTQGRVLGRHAGISRFTVGQRRGLGLSGPEPLYVVRLDAQNNRVVVGPSSALLADRLRVREVNWLGDEALPAENLRLEVKLRSTMRPVPASVSLAADGRGEVLLDAPHAGIAPGQACVFYCGERLLGGGWITRGTEPPAVATGPAAVPRPGQGAPSASRRR